MNTHSLNMVYTTESPWRVIVVCRFIACISADPNNVRLFNPAQPQHRPIVSTAEEVRLQWMKPEDLERERKRRKATRGKVSSLNQVPESLGVQSRA